MKAKFLFYLLIVFSIGSFGCTQNADSMEMKKLDKENSEFENMCTGAGYEWMLMKPTKDGKIIKEEDSCWGCMVGGIEHICDRENFNELVPPK